MWVAIVGASGTGKHEIKDLLVREDYEFMPIAPPSSDDLFQRQFQYLTQRIAVHLKAQEVMNKRDVVTIGSAYDCLDVHFRSLVHRGLLTAEQIVLSEYVEKNLVPLLKPPHSVIWTYAEPHTAFSRMELRGGLTVPPAEYNDQLTRYEEFATKIKVPLVEVDFSQPMSKILKDFEFNLASLRTTAVTAQTLWEREFLR